MVELDKSVSSLGAGSKYPKAPLSIDDQSTAFSSPRLKFIKQITITVNIAKIWQMYVTVRSLLLRPVLQVLLLATSIHAFIWSVQELNLSL
jgi:hypothetical protein